MIKFKKFVNIYNKTIFVLTLLLTLTSLVCAAIVNLSTAKIEAYANHNHSEIAYEQTMVAAVVPGLGNSQMVTEDINEENLPAACNTCGCPVYKCSKCYKEKVAADGKKTYDNTICRSNKTDKPCPMNITQHKWYKDLIGVTDIIDQLLNPILIILGSAGTIFVIVLGVNYSKSESADKREENKKRMINAIIGIAVTLLFLILVKVFTKNSSDIVKWINGVK